jgi:hypothetical protein
MAIPLAADLGAPDGATIRNGAAAGSRCLAWLIKARDCSVLPSPMSSARIPPSRCSQRNASLDAAGRADPGRPRTVYGSFDETRYRRRERGRDLAAWHEMLLDRFAGTPEDELLDRLAASPALAGPELSFLRAGIAERRGDTAQAAALVTECLKELPGDQEYLDFAAEVGAALPPRASQIRAERAAADALIAQAYRDGRVSSD